MSSKRVFLGTVVWFMGFLLPVMQHFLLMLAAVQEESYAYSYHNMVKYFFTLPWIMWIYLIGMIIVGFAMVVSGFKGTENKAM